MRGALETVLVEHGVESGDRALESAASVAEAERTRDEDVGACRRAERRSGGVDAPVGLQEAERWVRGANRAQSVQVGVDLGCREERERERERERVSRKRERERKGRVLPRKEEEKDLERRVFRPPEEHLSSAFRWKGCPPIPGSTASTSTRSTRPASTSAAQAVAGVRGARQTPHRIPAAPMQAASAAAAASSPPSASSWKVQRSAPAAASCSTCAELLP